MLYYLAEYVEHNFSALPVLLMVVVVSALRSCWSLQSAFSLWSEDLVHMSTRDIFLKKKIESHIFKYQKNIEKNIRL
jgi:hypothetical protein